MRGKVRNRATAVTQWPAADQSGQPIRTQIQQIIDETPGGAGTGDVVGPGSAVTNHVVSFDGATGKLIKDSGVLVADVVVTTDARMTNARTPTAHHASHENGGSDEMTVAGLNGVLADPQPPIIGAGATQAVAGNDARLTDARTPTAHAASHRSGGSDALVFDQTTSATGTQNNFSLNGPNTVLECSGAAPVFTGFTVAGSAPVGGDRAVLVYTGSGTMRVADQDGGSTAANRVIGESVRGQIVGPAGSITVVYDGATARWRIAGYNVGAAIPVTFNAADYSATGAMTVTIDAGDVTTYAYSQFGRWVRLQLVIGTVTLGGTADGVFLTKLPNGFTVAAAAQVGPAGSTLDGGGTWQPAATVSTSVYGADKWGTAKATYASFVLGTNNFYIQSLNMVFVD